MVTTNISLHPRPPHRRCARLGGVLALALVVLAACGGSEESASPASPAGAAPATTGAPSDGAIDQVPNGMYRRVVTTADGVRLGLDPELVADMLGKDGEMPLGLRIDGDRFEIFVTNDAGIEELGDVGTLAYDDGRLDVGGLVADWTFVDGVLVIGSVESGGEPALPDEMLVLSGEWTLEAATDGRRIPDGTYRRVATSADAEALGVDADAGTEFLGRDGVLPLGLRFDGENLALLVTNDAGIEEVGVAATIEYDGGRLMTNEACCGRSVIEWTYRDGVLVTELVEDPEGAPAHPIGQLLVSGEWTLDGSVTGEPGAGDEATLTFANPLSDLPPQIIAFATEVRDATGQALEWDVRQRAGSEQEVIASVLAGETDVAWVGARAFPEYDALLAPMLVDSYELQTAAFERGIVDRLSEALAERGLIALAVYPGPLQRVVGVDRPIVSVADFDGLEIGLFSDPPLQRRTLEALGAVPAVFEEHMDVSVLDGFTGQLGAVTGNSYEDEVAAVTANLNLWPRPLVVFMSLDRFEQLGEPLRQALLAGGAAAFDAAAAAALADDLGALDALCGATAELVEATDTDLAEIRTRLEPVYTELAEDLATEGVLDELIALKAELAVPPTLAGCPAT